VVEPENDDVAFEVAAVALGVAEVAEDRRAVVLGILALHLEAVADQRIAAGGVDHEASAILVHGAIGVGRAHRRRGRAAAEIHLAHAAVLAGLGHHAGGAPEEDLVELGAAHLVGAGHRPIGRVGELEARDAVDVGCDERGAELFHADGFDLAGNTELLEEGHVRRQQRLSDVEARVRVLLQQDHAMPPLGQEGRGGRTRGTTPDHDDITLSLHATFSFAVA